MVVNFNLSQISNILKEMIGKEMPYRHFISSGHGRAVSLTVTGVTLGNGYDPNWPYITLRHDLKFEDGWIGDYCTNGESFFEHYQPEIQKCLNKEVFWAVAADGVYPVLMDYATLKADHAWMICHDYKGTLIFETYARAQLCWYEKRDNGCWAAS